MINIDNPQGDAAIPVPVHDDNSPYRFEMIFDGSTKRSYADTWTELNEALNRRQLRRTRSQGIRCCRAALLRRQRPGGLAGRARELTPVSDQRQPPEPG